MGFKRPPVVPPEGEGETDSEAERQNQGDRDRAGREQGASEERPKAPAEGRGLRARGERGGAARAT